LIARPPRSARDVGVFVLAHVPLLASAALLYFVCVRHQQAANLYDQWRDHLADWSAPLAVPWFIALHTFGVIDYAAANAGAVTLPLTIVGGIALWRMNVFGRPTAILLLAPIALCLLAALYGRYPYGGVRTSAFLAGPVCLLAGAGFGAMVANRHRWARVAGATFGGVAIAILLFQTGRGLAVPRTRSHLRPVVEYLAEHRRPGDHVWVFGGAPSHVYSCYVNPIDPLTRLEVGREALPPLPRGRTWLVFASDPDHPDKTIGPRVADARKVATEREHVVVRGGAGYLFEVP
jgi:hypothetical protein